METYEMMMRRRAREAAKRAKVKKIKSAVGEIPDSSWTRLVGLDEIKGADGSVDAYR